VSRHALDRPRDRPSGGCRVYQLGPAGYTQQPVSRLFPDLDVAVLAEHAAMPDQDDAVRAYWDRLRGQG
jgi:hypothetical protein